MEADKDIASSLAPGGSHVGRTSAEDRRAGEEGTGEKRRAQKREGSRRTQPGRPGDLVARLRRAGVGILNGDRLLRTSQAGRWPGRTPRCRGPHWSCPGLRPVGRRLCGFPAGAAGSVAGGRVQCHRADRLCLTWASPTWCAGRFTARWVRRDSCDPRRRPRDCLKPAGAGRPTR